MAGTGIGNGAKLTIVVPSVVEMLDARERARFEWRPVHLAGVDTKFLEPVSLLPLVPHVAPKGAKASHTGCEVRDYTWIYVPTFGNNNPNNFVSDRDAPLPLPSVLAIGTPGWPELALTSERRHAFMAQPGTRWMKTSPLMVIAEKFVNRAPVTRAG